jgi:hypothetical protein
MSRSVSRLSRRSAIHTSGSGWQIALRVAAVPAEGAERVIPGIGHEDSALAGDGTAGTVDA